MTGVCLQPIEQVRGLFKCLVYSLFTEFALLKVLEAHRSMRDGYEVANQPSEPQNDH